ncbi:CREB3 protein, partial [Ceuthmochares aereus]|nr:CREB3 protein [Ceuthmochares aereus]
MSCSDELPVLANEDLIDFILRDDVPCSKIPVEENGLLEDCNLQDSELLDKELDDLINSVLSPIEDNPGTLQGFYPADSDISDYHHLSRSPGSNSISSPWSTDIVQVDHNYSLHEDWPGLQSVRSDVAQKDVSTGFGNFPMAVDVDKGPQFLSEAIMQVLTAVHLFPQVVLTEEEKQLLEKQGVALPSCLQLIKDGKQLLKKVRRRIRNKRSAQNSHRRRRLYTDGLKYRRVADCTAQIHKLAKEVHLLTKQNMSLLKRLRKLQAVVRKSTTKTMSRKACTMVSDFGPSVCEGVSAILIGLGERHSSQLAVCTSLAVLTQQIREFSGQLAAHLQEESVMEGCNPEPKDPFMLGSLNMSQEERQSPPNPDPGFSFYSGSSSDPLTTMGSEQSPPQPPVLRYRSNYLQAAVAWKAKGKEQVQHTADVVIQQHHSNEM